MATVFDRAFNSLNIELLEIKLTIPLNIELLKIKLTIPLNIELYLKLS